MLRWSLLARCPLPMWRGCMDVCTVECTLQLMTASMTKMILIECSRWWIHSS